MERIACCRHCGWPYVRADYLCLQCYRRNLWGRLVTAAWNQPATDRLEALDAVAALMTLHGEERAESLHREVRRRQMAQDHQGDALAALVREDTLCLPVGC